ncbi:hypothetical protein ACNOYI_004949, partial [Escherichia coli]
TGHFYTCYKTGEFQLLSSSLVLYCTNFEKTILHSSEEPPLQELRSFLFPTARIVTSPQRQGITK